MSHELTESILVIGGATSAARRRKTIRTFGIEDVATAMRERKLNLECESYTYCLHKFIVCHVKFTHEDDQDSVNV